MSARPGSRRVADAPCCPRMIPAPSANDTSDDTTMARTDDMAAPDALRWAGDAMKVHDASMGARACETSGVLFRHGSTQAMNDARIAQAMLDIHIPAPRSHDAE